ncbi:MAG: hypothetical protein ACPG4K_09880 [Haloferula sp.]
MHLEYARRYDLKIFVETGTFLGDTVEAMRPHFDRVYSIELADKYFEKAVRRFRGASSVKLLQGDSGDRMPEVVAELDAPTLFWLDGHYSGGDTAKGVLAAPVWAELKAIFGGMKHPFVILIDDARCFKQVGGEAYPAVSDIEAWVAEQDRGLSVKVAMDCIRIAPQG